VSILSDHPSVPAPTRVQRRAAVGERLLDSLEAIVARHRSTASSEPADLHAELIAAEVAHQLALTRAELRLIPFVRTDE
jgi:cytochrome P450